MNRHALGVAGEGNCVTADPSRVTPYAKSVSVDARSEGHVAPRVIVHTFCENFDGKSVIAHLKSDRPHAKSVVPAPSSEVALRHRPFTEPQRPPPCLSAVAKAATASGATAHQVA